MKSIDVLPCETSPKKLVLPEITLFRYTPTLREELERSVITRDEALRLYRAMLLHRR